MILFLISAMVPVSVLTTVTYRSVTRHIRSVTDRRLQDNAKAAGMAVVGQLRRAERTLDDWLASPSGSSDRPAGGLFESVRASPGPLGDLTDEESRRLSSGGTLLRVHRGDRTPRLVLMRQVPGGFGIGELVTDSVVSTARIYADGRFAAGICLAIDNDEIACDPPLQGWRTTSNPGSLRHREVFEWEGEDGGYVGAVWTTSLSAAFGGGAMATSVAETDHSLAVPNSSFRAGFLLAMAVSLATVFALSTILIRRSMEPLSSLVEAIRTVDPSQEEAPRVEIQSADEFEELGRAFNAMVGRIRGQFSFIRATRRLDQAILSSLSVHGVLQATVDAVFDSLDRSEATFFIPDSRVNTSGTLYHKRAVTSAGLESAPTELPRGGTHAIPTREWRTTYADGVEAGLVWKGSARSSDHCAFPVRSEGRLMAVMSFPCAGMSDEDHERAVQIGNQLGTALKNAQLVAELDSLNLGSIRALARTIDASSPWTSGHSERVSDLGVRIGRVMRIGNGELEKIRRGGLLHDIGKIGVSKEVLDKPGALTDGEFEEMRRHPTIGVSILEPIPQLEELLPMVRSHHERMDGSGYPDGLVGDEIHLYARILAVADVWDAITAERPYRPAMSFGKAYEIIRSGSGGHFDPRVVSAFSLIAREWYQGHSCERPKEREEVFA